jgi:hypothetical protein
VQARKQARNAVPGQRAEPHEDELDDENEYASDDDSDEYEEEYGDGEYEDNDAVEDGQITRNSAITAADAAQAALEQIARLIAKEPEGATAVEPAEDSWIVGVEVVEDRRIPSSADILAIYEAKVDAGGTLVSYRRTKRYSRGHCDPGGGL